MSQKREVLVELKNLIQTNGYEIDDDLLEAVLRKCDFDPDQAAARLVDMGFRLETSFPDDDVDENDDMDDDDVVVVSRRLSEEEERLKEEYSSNLSDETSQSRQ